MYFRICYCFCTLSLDAQDNQTGGWVVAEAAMAYGGVAAKAIRADQV